MLDCAALIEQRMAAAATRALQIAQGHRAGIVSLQAVSDTHDACWESLWINHSEMQLDNPEAASIRAVICMPNQLRVIAYLFLKRH